MGPRAKAMVGRTTVVDIRLSRIIFILISKRVFFFIPSNRRVSRIHIYKFMVGRALVSCRFRARATVCLVSNLTLRIYFTYYIHFSRATVLRLYKRNATTVLSS